MARPRRILLMTCALGLAAACTSTTTASPPSGSTPGGTNLGGANGGSAAPRAAVRGTVPSSDPAKADAVRTVIRQTMADAHLRSVIVRVTVDGKEIITEAFGDSMTGVPATTDMHFRNGAVAISYVATLLLQLVDEKKVALDDKVAKWLPDVPNADKVTLRQLAQMTSGYADYVQNPELGAATYADPFRSFTTDELIAYAKPEKLLYEPGTNWDYAHTNYVILGLALEKITGKPVSELMQEKVLGPLGLRNTTDPGNASITEPALHAFSSERREALGIPAGTGFSEESSFWNPSWTITHGAIQTTDIFDLHDGAIAMGTGKLLSSESYKAMVSTDLRGKTTAVPGCPTCFPQSEGYSYGLGIVTTGNWLMQNPLFGGYGAVGAYLPSQKIAIAVAVTFTPEAFDAQGGYVKIGANGNMADVLFRRIGAQMAPDDAPPVK